jgi:hypothetical protein
MTTGFENFGIFLFLTAIIALISPVSIHSVNYHVNLLGPTNNLFFGYLFLCPLTELKKEDATGFQAPTQPAYWSLDLSGVSRLSAEVSETLGYPAIRVEMYALGKSWNVSIYDGIRQFHESKCLDPYSQEVAIELGWPLLQVSCHREVLLAHSKPRIIVPILL